MCPAARRRRVTELVPAAVFTRSSYYCDRIDYYH